MAAAGEVAPASGTGVRGMVRGVDMGKVPAQTATAPAPTAAAEPVQVEPLSKIRKIIAERMHESLASTAQYTLNAEADATGLLALRQRIKANREELDLGNVNITDMVVYATIKALQKHPDVNSAFVDGELRRHSAVHMAVAIDTPRGLMVPVIPDSQALSLRELSTRIKALARQANEGSVSPDLLSGGTFTVSSMGALGITSFTPVLNPPQVAILGICNTQLKPVRRNGEVAFVDMIQLSLTCNHMVLDGAPGARFLKTLGSIIENFDLVGLVG